MFIYLCREKKKGGVDRYSIIDPCSIFFSLYILAYCVILINKNLDCIRKLVVYYLPKYTWFLNLCLDGYFLY